MKRTPKQKLYYSISEVAEQFGEEQYVLRYWEKEFPQLRPQKNRAGNRAYTDRDIAVIAAVHKLLRDEKYTIQGAKDHMRLFDPESGRFPEDTRQDQAAHKTDGDETELFIPEGYILMKREDVEEFHAIMAEMKKILQSK